MRSTMIARERCCPDMDVFAYKRRGRGRVVRCIGGFTTYDVQVYATEMCL